MNDEMLREMIVRLRRMGRHAWNESKEYHEKGHPDMCVYKDGQSSGLMTAINMLEVALENSEDAKV